METLKAIKQRRSIRSFETTNVSRKIINDIVNTARFSPSAKNRQPWLFVVPNKKKKDEIANLMTFQLKSSKDGATEKKIYNYQSSVNRTANIVRICPKVILIFRPLQKVWIESDYLSIGAAIENICLRALDWDLSTLIIRDIVYTRNEIAEMMGYKKMDLVAAVALGHPKSRPINRQRKKLEEILIYKK